MCPPAKVSMAMKENPPPHTHTHTHLNTHKSTQNDHCGEECAGPWLCSSPPLTWV